MAVADAMRSAAQRLFGRKPAGFFSSPGTFEADLTDLVNEVAADIAKYRDWQALGKFANITGGGGQTVFSLPDDYNRMMLNSDVRSSNILWGYEHIPDANEYMDRARHMNAGYPGIWTLFGNQMNFHPAPSGSVQFPYISKNYAKSVSGAGKPSFTEDTDEFVVTSDSRDGERLLTLGLVWRWRENKRLEGWEIDQDAFVKALDEVASRDRGSRVQRRSARYIPAGGRVAWYGGAW